MSTNTAKAAKVFLSFAIFARIFRLFNRRRFVAAKNAHHPICAYALSAYSASVHSESAELSLFAHRRNRPTAGIDLPAAALLQPVQKLTGDTLTYVIITRELSSLNAISPNNCRICLSTPTMAKSTFRLIIDVTAAKMPPNTACSNFMQVLHFLHYAPCIIRMGNSDCVNVQPRATMIMLLTGGCTAGKPATNLHYFCIRITTSLLPAQADGHTANSFKSSVCRSSGGMLAMASYAQIFHRQRFAGNQPHHRN